MSELRLRAFTARDLSVLQSWFQHPSMAARLSFPNDDWLAYARKGPASVYAVESDGHMVAQIQIDRGEDRSGYLSIAVDPALWRRGFGQRALKAFLSTCDESITLLIGYVEPCNLASQALLRRVGFMRCPQKDEDGFFAYVHPRDVHDPFLALHPFWPYSFFPIFYPSFARIRSSHG